MKCTVCGTHMDRIIADLPFKLSEGRIVILRQLPVLQCAVCSEYLLDDGVMARIDEILAQSDESAELEVLRYAA